MIQLFQNSKQGGVDNIRLDLNSSSNELFGGSLKLADNILSCDIDNPHKDNLVCRFDWFTLVGVVSKDNWLKVWRLVMGYEQVVEQDGGKKYRADPGYQRKFIGEQGQQIQYKKVGDNYDLLIWLQGTFMSSCTILEQFTFCHKFLELGLKPTRCDIKIIDYSKQLNIFEVREAVNKCNYKGFQKKRFLDSGGLDGTDGITLELGSRESDSFTRIYEHFVKHGDRANALEAEIKGDKIAEFWKFFQTQIHQLFDPDSPFDMNLYIQGMVRDMARVAVSYVDFIDREYQGKQGYLGDCPRLSFWQDFLDRIGKPLSLPLPKKEKSLAKTGKWTRKAWAKTIYILREGLGSDCCHQFIDFLGDCVRKDKVDGYDRAAINILKREGMTELFSELDFC